MGIMSEKNSKQFDNIISSLSTKTIAELMELLQRQEKLLKNVNFINKLPDKGEKVRNLYEKITKELNNRDETMELCKMFQKFEIDDCKKRLDEMEWQKNMKGKNDEDEDDVIKILATHSGTCHSSEKQIINESLSFAPLKGDIEKYAKDLCSKFDETPESRYKFYTYKNESSSCHVASKISLQESLKLYQQQTHQLKEIEMKHAFERLSSKLVEDEENREEEMAEYEAEDINIDINDYN